MEDLYPVLGVGGAFLGLVAQHELDLRAHVRHGFRAGTFLDVGDGRDSLDQRSVPRLGLPESLLRSLELRNVADYALEGYHVAFVVVDALARLLDVPHLPVPPTDGIAQLEALAPSQRALDFLPDSLAVLFQDQISKPHRTSEDEVFGRVAG
jgi:hypothetical protein